MNHPITVLAREHYSDRLNWIIMLDPMIRTGNHMSQQGLCEDQLIIICYLHRCCCEACAVAEGFG